MNILEFYLDFSPFGERKSYPKIIIIFFFVTSMVHAPS